MRPDDIFSMDLTNLDSNTENFTLDYYLEYISYYPEYFITIRPFISSISTYDNKQCVKTRHDKHENPGNNINNYANLKSNSSNSEENNIGQDFPRPLTHLCNIPILGYIFGKLENKQMLCVHISGISICPHARGKRLGGTLLNFFHVNGNSAGAYFSELFVRVSNTIAINFYAKCGYKLYRKILGYYIFPNEDASEMRLPLKKDEIKRCSLLDGKDISSVLL